MCRLKRQHCNDEIDASNTSFGTVPTSQPTIADDCSLIQKRRICIVGAGPGGLSLAYYLQKCGYKYIHVYEKEPVVGGKTTGVWCDSTKQYVGSGQYTINRSYREILELAKSFGIDLVGDEVEITYFDVHRKCFQNGMNHSVANLFREILKTSNVLKSWSEPFCNMISKLSQKSPFSWVIIWTAFSSIVDAKSKRDISKIFQYIKSLPEFGFVGISNHICETVTRFFDLENMSSVAKYCIQSIWNKWAPAGYLSCASSVPVLFKLKLMQIAPFRGWHMVNPDGYYLLCKAMEGKINSIDDSAVYTDKAIEKIQRQGEAAGRVTITVDGNEMHYDQLIITGHLNDVVPLMVDASEEEVELSQQISTTDYVVTIAEISGLPPKPVIYIPSHWEPQSTGHVFLVSRVRYDNVTTSYNTERYSIFQYGTHYETGEKIPDPMLFEILHEDITLLGGTIKSIEGRKRWDYFPHPNVTALKSGFFDRLDKMQGIRSTYYAGSTLNFELTEATVRYSKYLVEKYFVDMNNRKSLVTTTNDVGMNTTNNGPDKTVPWQGSKWKNKCFCPCFWLWNYNNFVGEKGISNYDS